MAGAITLENENVGSRMVPIVSGISTTLQNAISTKTDTTIEFDNAFNSGLHKGDFVQIDEEIIRIATEPVAGSDTVTVIRGQLGTKLATHADASIARVITPIASEFRRNSILRASGHTFEYVGFGPGNYSTALPEKQDRVLTPQEELLSQSVKKSGGINVYTGMNDQGDFYVGNKKVSSATGQEEVFDAPIPTVTGEDLDVAQGLSVGFDVLTPLEVTITRSLKVEGGTDNNLISEFDGPVLFNKKVTSLGSVENAPSSFKVMPQFLERLELELQHLPSTETQETSSSSAILPLVDMLDGSSPPIMIGLDLAM